LRKWAGVNRRHTGTVLVFEKAVGDPAAARLLGLVSGKTGVPVAMLLHKSRCTADIAEARQLAMYLMHVVQRRTYEQIGKTFGRERTTVSHACAVVEDRRDDAAFESRVAAIEAQLLAEPQMEAERAAG